MQNTNENTLKEIIEKLLKSYRWEDKLDAVKVKESWDGVVGSIFSKHTTRLYVKNKVLYVSFDSSVLRQELHMVRSKIVDAINKKLGSKVIDDIVLR